MSRRGRGKLLPDQLGLEETFSRKENGNLRSDWRNSYDFKPLHFATTRERLCAEYLILHSSQGIVFVSHVVIISVRFIFSGPRYRSPTVD